MWFCFVALDLFKLRLSRNFPLTFTGSSMLGKHSMICSSPGDLLPHAQSCAKYFDCSSKSNGGIPRTRECPYPHLFDRATKSCRYFTEVDCKDRPEPKHPCK